MAIEHADLTDPELHEPKGVALANAGEVYLADGAGSGAWDSLGIDSIDLDALWPEVEAAIIAGDIPITQRMWVTGVIDDISTPATIFIGIPQDAIVIGARMVLAGAITIADATITIANASGSSMGTQLVPFSGSATGDAFDWLPSANETLTGPTHIQVTTDGGSTDAQKLYVTVELTTALNPI